MGNAIYDSFSNVTITARMIPTIIKNFKITEFNLDVIPLVFTIVSQDIFITIIRNKTVISHIKKFFISNNISLLTILRAHSFCKMYFYDENGSLLTEKFIKDIQKIIDVALLVLEIEKKSEIIECKKNVKKTDEKNIEKLVQIKQVVSKLTKAEIEKIMKNIMVFLHGIISNPTYYELKCTEPPDKVINEEHETIAKVVQPTSGYYLLSNSKALNNNTGGRKISQNKKRTTRKKCKHT